MLYSCLFPPNGEHELPIHAPAGIPHSYRSALNRNLNSEYSFSS